MQAWNNDFEGLWMANFAVDKGLFNRKENDKWMESKRTNQCISELNVFMKMSYELVKARQEKNE